MVGKKSICAVAITALMLLSSVLLFWSQKASAASWTETSDTDFSDGNFFTGTGFETELIGSGVAAYIQNKKDAVNWLQKFPASDPGPRRGFGFSNDSFESRFILFGGVDQFSSARNDTWEYVMSTGNWVRICNDDTPACGPPRRSNPSMAYDNNSKVAVLYGGYAADFMTVLTDTWEYDVTTNTWTNHTSIGGPRGLGSHAMVYDAVGKQMIMVGRGAISMEVWAYDVATHTWTQKSPSGGPSMRASFALAYSYQANHKRVVLFGGAEILTQFDDTWEYNPQTDQWQNTTPTSRPSARANALMTYVFKTSIEGLILWGGTSYSTETWRYSWNPSPTWEMLTVGTYPTPTRREHGMAYDNGYDSMIMYGGITATGTRLNDTWFIQDGYRLEGKYASHFYNTYEFETVWKYIFWNETSPPINTQIRFQVNYTNNCDEGQTPIWRGPGGNPALYFTAPGQSLGPIVNFKCLKYLVDMITTNPAVAPKFQDITIIYDAIPNPPKVISVSPTSFNIPVNAYIYINFTKPMNTANTWLSVTPNVTLDTPWNWYSGNSQVRITHNTQPFIEGRRYDICVWGTDTFGNPLNHTDNKYCWLFVTRGIPPTITNTVPNNGASGVAVTANVQITFSEPMNPSTCWPYITISPDVTPKAWGWNPTATVLTMYHNSTRFTQLTDYTVEVPYDAGFPCTDASGIQHTVGPVPNPWTFSVGATDPYITSTDPQNLQTDVPTNQVIRADFSRWMNMGSLTYALKDLVTGANWTGILTTTWQGNLTVTFAHTTPFDNCRPYEMHIWALDYEGKSLIPNPAAPNPWRFATVGTGPNGCAPYILFTIPIHGQLNVPNTDNIIIGWHYNPDPPTGGMNPSSFLFSVKDSFGTELSSNFNPVWTGMGPDVVELQHPGFPFVNCERYTVTVLQARDLMGRNFIPGLATHPLTFYTNTTNCPPVILWTQPANGTLNAPLDQDIKIKFNKAIDTGTFTISVRPDVPPYTYTWFEGDTNVTVTHASFTGCQWYNVTVNALDTSGNPLIGGPVPNPWTFRAFCTPTGPYITDTSPYDGQTDVPRNSPIYVNFSEPMDTASLSFQLTPGAGTLGYNWMNGDATVQITHSTDYVECQTYTARVVSARNKAGVSLVSGPAPNPWTFKAKCDPPFITSTIPFDGQADVPLDQSITVVFNEPMDQASLVFQTTPPLNYTQTWPNAQTVVLSHAIPFTICTDYIAEVVQARDRDGAALVGGPVPNPWTFKTDCKFPLNGLQVHREGNDVRLTWTPSPGALSYLVYHANNRLTPWPWTEIANVTTNFALLMGHISDMQDHYYIVRGYKAGGEGSNSTMGVLRHMQITPNVGTSNVYWFSLPYNSIYKKASDVTSELGPSKISVIAKWDSARQRSILYYYLNGAWRGRDFAINPGDGLWLGVLSSFDWAVNGTDKTISLLFMYHNPPMTNYYWIGLPYTGKLGTASELVISIAGGLGPGTNTKIVEVGKWNFQRQASDIFMYGSLGWGGTDFLIGSGDGIWVKIVSTFAWAPPLITPEVP